MASRRKMRRGGRRGVGRASALVSADPNETAEALLDPVREDLEEDASDASDLMVDLEEEAAVRSEVDSG